MLIYQGHSAYSPFRINKLLKRAQAQIPELTTLDAHFLYFVDVEENLSKSQEKIVQQLLGADKRLTQSAQGSVIAVPRIGTISSWSSKATDIAHHANLKNIKRIEIGIIYSSNLKDPSLVKQLGILVHDRMTESVFFSLEEIQNLFMESKARAGNIINILDEGIKAIEVANKQMGLALSTDEIKYLYKNYLSLQRNPTDTELMMFAQANSEHCRHKIFNADWIIDGQPQSHTLFDMIRNTYQQHPQKVLSAYNDNGAVLQGSKAGYFFADSITKCYKAHPENIHIVIKVETHNHPTAISPFPGAATGSGGEIRDEGATGRGARPKAGLTGFSVSNLHIPNFQQPWEIDYGKPEIIASAFEIMLEAPIGAAAFNNEFGRPNLCGYFRTYEEHMKNEMGAIRGYHKPIMIAGGLANIREQHVQKSEVTGGTKIVVLGGPAMLIGMGGGAASSVAAGSGQAELDFASVQRSNPEMERRAQEVINSCWALGEKNPILSIHDVGAGGLSNALPELVHGSSKGGIFNLRKIPNADFAMSPMEIWCNEAQERYVLAIDAKQIELFKRIAERERCPYAIVGEATEEQNLRAHDEYFNNNPVDLPLSVLLGKPPKIQKNVEHLLVNQIEFFTQDIDIKDAAYRILHLPAVADKSFLITIGDRSITGLVARDQMVGPWQVPVADVAVTAASYDSYFGEAMAMGERSPIALIHPAASARMAVGEAITNIAAAMINDISDIKLSANWMAACGYPGEDANLFDAVQAIGMELCPALGICIPVGKDSLSMRTVWEQAGEKRDVTAPLSLIVSAFAPVKDIRKTLTPQLQTDQGETELILIDLGEGCNFLGGSALAQVYNHQGDLPPDIDDPELIKNFFKAIQSLNQKNLLLAYHDRSDGGLFVTLCEMAFAAHVGISVSLDSIGSDPVASLFSEELGAVIQVRKSDIAKVLKTLQEHNLIKCTHQIGKPNQTSQIEFQYNQQILFSDSRVNLHRAWSATSYHMQSLRDHPECAKEAYEQLLNENDPGLNAHLTFELPTIYINLAKPKVAILREQGVNGHVEMAAAFDRVGFTAVDVHMTDILSGNLSLIDFHGLAACGGFSYGDVLGAGTGWANSILLNEIAYKEFKNFFARENTFTLGICNGCQMLSQLTSIIPGSTYWPRFYKNKSEQFEARLSLVEIQASPSIFFKDMQGSRLPIAVAHGEGRAVFAEGNLENALSRQLISLRYVNNNGHFTEQYPANPNGSPEGITGLTTKDGRVTILMPHPERVFRTVQFSWHPKDWGEYSPWLKMFMNARAWLG